MALSRTSLAAAELRVWDKRLGQTTTVVDVWILWGWDDLERAIEKERGGSGEAVIVGHVVVAPSAVVAVANASQSPSSSPLPLL